MTAEAPEVQPETPAPATEPVKEEPAARLLDRAMDETIKRQQQQIVSEEDKFRWLQRLSKMFVAAGTFSDVKGATEEQARAQAMVKIMLGESAGLSPIEAMQSVVIVYGRPSFDSAVRAARMKRVGYYWVFRQFDEKGCILIPCHLKNAPLKLKTGAVIHPFVNEDGSLATVGFTMDDAIRARLVKDGGAYKSYPADMMFTKAISRMQRRFAPEVLNGVDLPDVDDMKELREAESKRPLFTHGPIADAQEPAK